MSLDQSTTELASGPVTLVALGAQVGEEAGAEPVHQTAIIPAQWPTADSTAGFLLCALLAYLAFAASLVRSWHSTQPTNPSATLTATINFNLAPRQRHRSINMIT